MPHSPDDALQETINKTLEALQLALGDHLAAVYGYGSSFGRSPQGPRQLLLVLSDTINRRLLDELAPVMDRARAAGVGLRLDTPEGLVRGADAFPVFALELSATSELLLGKDVLENLDVDGGRLRLRLEQSLRVLHRDLVHGYLDKGSKPQHLAATLRAVAHRLIYLFEATLVAFQIELPAKKSPRSIIEALCRDVATPKDAETWEQLRALAAYEVVLDEEPLAALYDQVLRALGSVIEVVDRMEVG